MTQKHCQKKISGSLDAIRATQLFKHRPKPKRARTQCQRARENRAQAQQSKVESMSYLGYCLSDKIVYMSVLIGL